MVFLGTNWPRSAPTATDGFSDAPPQALSEAANSATMTRAEPEHLNPEQVAKTDVREPEGYIADSDISWVRERMTARVKRLVESVMAERDPEYELLFAELGIPTAERAGIKSRIAHLYRRRAEAGIIMSEMVQAQGELENHMKRISSEARNEYLDFEEATKARTEVSNIATYLRDQGVTLTPDELQRLLPAVQKHGAYTRKTLSGACSPFDPPTVPFTGRAIIPRFETRHKDLSAALAALVTVTGHLKTSQHGSVQNQPPCEA